MIVHERDLFVYAFTAAIIATGLLIESIRVYRKANQRALLDEIERQTRRELDVELGTLSPDDQPKKSEPIGFRIDR